MDDCMMFPKDWHDFLKSYSFTDSEKVYTNGSELIPVFRVEQLFEHLMAEKQAEIERLKEEVHREYHKGWLDGFEGYGDHEG